MKPGNKQILFLISDKIDFKQQLIRKEKEWFILNKRTISQEEIKILNIYAPNTVTTNFMKSILFMD